MIFSKKNVKTNNYYKDNNCRFNQKDNKNNYRNKPIIFKHN